MLGNSIDINNLWLVLQSSSSEQKQILVKPLAIAVIESNLDKKGVRIAWATHRIKNHYFRRNNKNRLKAFKKFLFAQNIFYVLIKFMNLCLFSQKMVIKAKTAVSFSWIRSCWYGQRWSAFHRKCYIYTGTLSLKHLSGKL